MVWIVVATYGFFTGPALGYMLELVKRVTPPSDAGDAIIMLGQSLTIVMPNK
jgi:hypothetical protein